MKYILTGPFAERLQTLLEDLGTRAPTFAQFRSEREEPEVYYPDDPTPDGWRYPVNLGRPAESSGGPR
jgi:hypothetical protein